MIDSELHDTVSTLQEQVAELHGLTIPLASLAPAPYRLKKPFSVVLAPYGDEYTATFYDADLSATGETKAEAIELLKDALVSSYELLADHGEDQLGPAMQKEWAVLQEFIEPIAVVDAH
jgi:hypothetical protein